MIEWYHLEVLLMAMESRDWIRAFTPAGLTGGPMLFGFCLHLNLLGMIAALLLSVGLIGILLELQSIGKKLDQLNQRESTPPAHTDPVAG